MGKFNNVPSFLGESGQQSAAKRLSAILAGPGFKVDRLACAAAASVISGYRASVGSTPWGNLSKRAQLVFKLALVSICHQFNWDFLQQRLAAHFLRPDEDEMIQRLVRVRADELEIWLSGYHKPQRIQASSRAAILRALGKELTQTNVQLLVESSQGRIEGPTGFIAQLDNFEQYRIDPLRKKSYVLVQELIREGIVSFEDEHSLRPAVDYHIMRLYLRSGRVVPLYDEVANALRAKVQPRARLVRLLREAVGEALQTTASHARLSVAAVNYIEWQLGRSVCVAATPVCLQNRLPSGLDLEVAKLFRGSCPYIGFCHAYKDENWRKLKEPNFVSTFY